ncbi:MAG: gephyrin-like molybdotransferase Glp [Ilumatobacteraceae bacterium]
MTPLDEVRAHVLSRLPAPVAVDAPFDSADGLALAADVTAPENVPPFDNTAVDGYAVIAADTEPAPCTLRVTGEMAAGAVHTDEVRPGCAVRIMTGAPLPAGCDAVVMVEDTENPGDGTVRVLRTVEPGASIRRAGSDVREGDVPLRAGTVVTPAVQAVLATLNARTVRVMRRPRVGVMSTGDELVDDGSPLGPGQIRESNRIMLLRLVRAAGADAVDLGIVRDDEAVLEAAVRSAVDDGIDVLVTSGGVSMGDYDVVKAVLSRIADMAWFQIAMKPAKPFAFGTLTGPTGRTVPVFGLPGNPVSSLVSFELIARPAIEVMSGHAVGMTGRRRVLGIIDHAVQRRPDGKVHFDRCTATFGDDGRLHVGTVTAQGSHQLAATAMANALVEIPDGNGVNAGDDVWVTLLGAGLATATGA